MRVPYGSASTKIEVPFWSFSTLCANANIGHLVLVIHDTLA